MSIKQKEEITIWAFKDGKKGHEKQVEALISEISLFKKIDLHQFTSWENHNSVPDIIIGAGNDTHKHMLTAKKEHPKAKTIVLMKPSLRPTQWFDIAIVPDMDTYYLGKPKNVITTKGVLSKYSDLKTKPKTGLIIIGGKSRHYHFRKNVVKQQIEWLVNDLFKDYQWKITTSPRSPNLDIPVHSGNASFFSWKDTPENWLSEEIKQSEITFLTPESVSVLYEGLSTNTKVYVFHHEHHTDGQYSTKRNTKVTKNIDKLKDSGQIGYIDSKRYLLSRSIKSADLVHPKINEPLSETKKVVQKLLEIL
jgi:mitochondrial fission protein ELM1